MRTRITLLVYLVLSVAILQVCAGGGKGKHKVTFKIGIPHHTIKHTHTIYKIIHDKPHDHKGYEEASKHEDHHGWGKHFH